MSLPFEICGEPFSLIQYGTGIDAHFGLRPEAAVIRVYARAVWEKTSTTRMNAYFFKLPAEYGSNLILECLDWQF